ncbi:MAG: hypothetical protein ABFR62_06795 [Bacteroidota bacterium]
MSKLISFIILTSYFLVISFQSIPFFEYITNYEYISQELCENKDNPEMGCNGKCYLIKKTRALAEDQEEKEATISERLSLEYFAFDYALYSEEKDFDIELKDNFIYQEHDYNIYSELRTPPPKYFT